MIVIGYQGIGKSTLVKEHNSCIDFESSNFKINGMQYQIISEGYRTIAYLV